MLNAKSQNLQTKVTLTPNQAIDKIPFTFRMLGVPSSLQTIDPGLNVNKKEKVDDFLSHLDFKKKATNAANGNTQNRNVRSDRSHDHSNPLRSDAKFKQLITSIPSKQDPKVDNVDSPTYGHTKTVSVHKAMVHDNFGRLKAAASGGIGAAKPSTASTTIQ